MDVEIMTAFQIRVVREGKEPVNLIVKQFKNKSQRESIEWFCDLLNMIADNPPERIDESNENFIIISKPIHKEPMWMKSGKEECIMGESFSIEMQPFDGDKYDLAI